MSLEGILEIFMTERINYWTNSARLSGLLSQNIDIWLPQRNRPPRVIPHAKSFVSVTNVGPWQSLLLEFGKNPMDRIKGTLLQLCGNNNNWIAILLNSYYRSRALLCKHFNILYNFLLTILWARYCHYYFPFYRWWNWGIESNLLKTDSDSKLVFFNYYVCLCIKP